VNRAETVLGLGQSGRHRQRKTRESNGMRYFS
jgi:hypothetical protein